MESAKHLKAAILLALTVLLIGTLGYMVVEGWNFIDALYMAVITVSSVGYKEVHDISNMGRLFTIFFVMSGVGVTVYVAGVVVQFMVEGRMRVIMGRRKLDKQIDR